MTNADRNYYIRLNTALDGLLDTEGAVVAAVNPDTGQLEENSVVEQTDYVNISELPNIRWLPLGTDNFGRDVLTELISATRVSFEHRVRGGNCSYNHRSDSRHGIGIYRWSRR